MKRIFLAVFILVFVLLMSSCQRQEEISPEIPESSQSLAEIIEQSQNPADEELIPVVPNESFYPAENTFFGNELETQNRSAFKWNEDGSLTFQNKNSLVTLSEYNEVIKTVTLPEEYLPGERYILVWNDRYIVAFSTDDAYGDGGNIATLYKTTKGGVYLVNSTVFDAKGNVLERFRITDIFAEGEWQDPPLDGGDFVEYMSYSIAPYMINWLNETQLIFNFDTRVVLFDLEYNSGKILLDPEKEFDSYNLLNDGHDGCVDGYYYCLGYKNDGRSCVFMFDEKGFVMPFKDTEANQLQCGDGFIIAVDTDSDYNEIISYSKAGSLESRLIADNARVAPQAFGKYIWWQTSYGYGPNENAFYVYNTESGEQTVYKTGCEGYQLLHKVTENKGKFKYFYEEHDAENNRSFWVYDEASGQKTELDYESANNCLYIYEDYVSPTGESYIEYDDYYSFSNLRLVRFE